MTRKRLKEFPKSVPVAVILTLILIFFVWPATTTAGGLWSYVAYAATAAVIYQWYYIYKSNTNPQPSTETKE